MQYFRYLDLFGAPLIFNIQKDVKYNKTVLGGLSSLIIYSLILVYAIVNLQTWANGDLLPTTTVEKSQITKQFNPALGNLSIQWSLFQYESQFSSYNNTLPKQDIAHQWFTIIIFGGDGIPKTIDMNQDGEYRFNIDFLEENDSNQGTFYILSCDPTLITVGKCEEQAFVDEIIRSNALYFIMIFNLTYINPQTQKINQVPETIWIGLENGFTHMSTINLGATLFSMQKAAILKQEEQYYAFTSQKQSIETFTEQYGKNAYQIYFSSTKPKGHVYINQFFTLDLVSEFVKIEYPSIFTVLGNIGAIGSILLSFRLVLYYYSTQNAEALLIEEVILNLIPRYKQLIVHQSFGQFKSVSLQGTAVNTQQYLQSKQVMKLLIYQNFSVAQIVINQILLARFMEEMHPNFKYVDKGFESLFAYEDQLNCDLDPNKQVNNTDRSIRSVNAEPFIQDIK